MSRFASADDRDGRRARVRAELGATDDTVVVGAVGRMVLEKGYAELFEAWDRLRADLPQAMLVVVGPDDDDKADSVPRELVDRARATGVKFLGMRSDVEDLYCGFDVYVLASHREGFPRSAMEAAAGGLPIIATDIRGCRQVVADGQTGLLVPVRSPEGLERALRDLVGDDDRRRTMGQAAAVRALQEFDQQRVIDLTLLTYRKLLLKAGLPLPTPVAAP
jgi:glycosyltransferase involved in cell wall biosynthesis